MGKIKVLLVDKSKEDRQLITAILENEINISVIAEAEDSKQALELTNQFDPDVILIDISMPRDEGLNATKKIMAYKPTPIIVLTVIKTGESVAKTFDALKSGAVEVLEKPLTLNQDNSQLIRTICIVSKVKTVTHMMGYGNHIIKETGPSKKKDEDQVIFIASSTGGPSSLKTLLCGLSPQIDAGIIIAQHIANGFVPGLISWLQGECKINISEAKEGDKIEKGLILFCPAGFHTKITKKGLLNTSEVKNEHEINPSADILFKSGAEFYKNNAVGIVLTGMGSDGAQGLLAIKRNGGYTIAQDEKSSIIYGMPKKAAQLNAAMKILPLKDISNHINFLLRNRDA